MGLLAMIAGTVSHLHTHVLVARHGQPVWVAALTPLSVDEMIAAASTTLLAGSRSGRKGGAWRGRCWSRAAWRAWPRGSRQMRVCAGGGVWEKGNPI
jgi:hypothetical protein